MSRSRVLLNTRWGLAALMIAGLAGCGGGDSGSSTTTTGGGGTGGGGTTTTPVITSTAPTNATASNANQAFQLIDAQGAAVLTVNSPPVLRFTVIDSSGNPVPGLSLMDQTPGANLDNCGTGSGSLRYARNVRAAIAKLIPGSNNAPAQWQNLIYSTSTSSGNGGSATAPLVRATTDPTPSTTNNAPTSTLTYANGVYTYKFSTDVTNASYNTGPINADGSANANQWTSTLDSTGATVAAAKATGGVLTNGHVLTKDASTTYRVAVQLCYMDNGTRVYANPTYDFTVDSSGVSHAVTDPSKTRKVVNVASCNECHSTLTAHGSRVQTDYCVMCHNVDTQDKTPSPTAGAPANTSVDFKLMVHKIHMGERLMNGFKIGTSDFSDVTYPQDQANCTKCHDGSANATHKTPQGDNWMNVPSRNACGACHDGIDFATGLGMTIDGNANGKNGHVGGAQADDSKCVLCHSPSAIASVYHPPVYQSVSTSTSTLGQVTYYHSGINSSSLPAGAVTVDYDIKSVSLNASRNPVMVFRMLQSGVRKDLNTAQSTTDTALWPNFFGAPSIYFAFSVPQDGIATPSDFNVYYNAGLQGIWNGSATGTSAGTLTGPDANGYYTVTLTGRTIPTNASLLTGAMGYAAMLQTNVPGYERTCTTTVVTNCVAGFNDPAQDVKLVATGFTARRITTEAARCNLCHASLGIFAESNFHSGQRNDPTMCAMCHNANRASSMWTADSGAFVHRLHAASKRAYPDTWHATTSATAPFTLTGGFYQITYPGILNNCVQCHAPGGYDFSAGAAQVGNRLYRTVATGNTAAAGTAAALTQAPYAPLAPGQNYGTGWSTSDVTTTTPSATTTGLNLVNSPIANNCFACHDGDMASQPGTTTRAHFEWGGGSIYRARGYTSNDRSTVELDPNKALGRAEQCLACHGPTGIAPIKVVHGVQ